MRKISANASEMSMLNEYWSNKDNADYYEKISVDIQKKFSITGGLNSNCDMQVINNYINNSNSIFEVGAGYGRVLAYLIKNNYTGEITAIERSQQFFKILTSDFKENITIFNKDLLTFRTHRKFDLVLWLWCGISDFSPHEQENAINSLINLLTPHGKLILETLCPKLAPTNATIFNKQTYFIQQDNCYLYGYIPTQYEMAQYAKHIGIDLVKEIPYKTTTGRSRVFYIFQRY